MTPDDIPALVQRLRDPEQCIDACDDAIAALSRLTRELAERNAALHRCHERAGRWMARADKANAAFVTALRERDEAIATLALVVSATAPHHI